MPENWKKNARRNNGKKQKQMSTIHKQILKNSTDHINDFQTFLVVGERHIHTNQFKGGKVDGYFLGGSSL